MVVPVIDDQDRLIAVLDMDSAEPCAFDSDDARGVEEIVRRVFARS
jgi:GAF domain-containing protein